MNPMLCWLCIAISLTGDHNGPWSFVYAQSPEDAARWMVGSAVYTADQADYPVVQVRRAAHFDHERPNVAALVRRGWDFPCPASECERRIRSEPDAMLGGMEVIASAADQLKRIGAQPVPVTVGDTVYCSRACAERPVAIEQVSVIGWSQR